MATRFSLPSNGKIDTFKDNVSIGDTVEYEIDFTAWEQDNTSISGSSDIIITVEYGSVTVANKVLSAGVLTFTAAFNQAGKALLSILANTSREDKKLWLEVRIKDPTSEFTDDYGISA